MRILFASAEAYPLAKTGGLADVSGALPRALAEFGVDVRLVLPGYPQVLAAAADKKVARDFADGNARLISARMPDSGIPVWLLECPKFYARSGSPYTDRDGRDWPDNAQRFALFCQVAAGLALGNLVDGWRADIVHANDWHAGLLPVLLGTGDNRPATIFTIHNLAYQGLFPSSTLPSLGIDDEHFTPDGIEFYGKVSFLKAGIRFSDRITTVSPSYAREIMTPDYGCGLDGLLRQRMHHVSGILNGVDYAVWSPEQDPHLPARFSADDMSGKLTCKRSLQRELALDADPAVPLVVWLSRITDQKMADVVTRTLNRIMDRDVQLAVLGDGDPALEEQFQEAAQHYPGRLAVRIGYQEPLAHRYLGGADLLLHPCRFEPCGLTPLYAMRYGVLPLVRQVGGLTDTIVYATEWTIRAGNATGFCFRDVTASAMLDCLDRALGFYTEQALWNQMRRRAMSRRFGWDSAARRYLALYRKLGPAQQPQPVPTLVPEQQPEHVTEQPERVPDQPPGRESTQPSVWQRTRRSLPLAAAGARQVLANSIQPVFPDVAAARTG
jgi:starch synthase